MFKYVVLSSLVLVLCIDPVFLQVTVTTTQIQYSTFTQVVFKQSICISSGTTACRRKRGIMYENPFPIFDVGTGQAPLYIYSGLRIVPASLLPRIDADPIGLENWKQENNYFLSGEPYIETSMQEIKARNGGSDQTLASDPTPRIFGSLVSNIINFGTTTTTVSLTLATTSTSTSTSLATVKAACVPIPYAVC